MDGSKKNIFIFLNNRNTDIQQYYKDTGVFIESYVNTVKKTETK